MGEHIIDVLINVMEIQPKLKQQISIAEKDKYKKVIDSVPSEMLRNSHIHIYFHYLCLILRLITRQKPKQVDL